MIHGPAINKQTNNTDAGEAKLIYSPSSSCSPSPRPASAAVAAWYWQKGKTRERKKRKSIEQRGYTAGREPVAGMHGLGKGWLGMGNSGTEIPGLSRSVEPGTGEKFRKRSLSLLKKASSAAAALALGPRCLSS